MADKTVSAAESYSEKIAVKIRTIELLSALDMLSLVILVIMQTLRAMQMAMQNRLLEQKAFIDAHTGLPNKSACNEIFDKKGSSAECAAQELPPELAALAPLLESDHASGYLQYGSFSPSHYYCYHKM